MSALGAITGNQAIQEVQAGLKAIYCSGWQVAGDGNSAGEILLVERKESAVWLFPTGWADVGYSPAEVAVKEVEEVDNG